MLASGGPANYMPQLPLAWELGAHEEGRLQCRMEGACRGFGGERLGLNVRQHPTKGLRVDLGRLRAKSRGATGIHMYAWQLNMGMGNGDAGQVAANAASPGRLPTTAVGFMCGIPQAHMSTRTRTAPASSSKRERCGSFQIMENHGFSIVK